MRMFFKKRLSVKESDLRWTLTYFRPYIGKRMICNMRSKVSDYSVFQKVLHGNGIQLEVSFPPLTPCLEEYSSYQSSTQASHESRDIGDITFANLLSQQPMTTK